MTVCAGGRRGSCGFDSRHLHSPLATTKAPSLLGAFVVARGVNEVAGIGRSAREVGCSRRAAPRICRPRRTTTAPATSTHAAYPEGREMGGGVAFGVRGMRDGSRAVVRLRHPTVLLDGFAEPVMQVLVRRSAAVDDQAEELPFTRSPPRVRRAVGHRCSLDTSCRATDSGPRSPALQDPRRPPRVTSAHERATQHRFRPPSAVRSVTRRARSARSD